MNVESKWRLAAWGLVVGLLVGCSKQQPATAPAKTPTLPTAAHSSPTESPEVVTADLQLWPRVVRVQGSMLPDEETVVGAKVAGRVRELQVDIGSVVRQGQVLAVLDSEDFELRVQQAEAQVAQVRSKLGLKGDEPDSKLDRLKSPPVVQEKALVDEARSNLDRARQAAASNAFSAEELQRREAVYRVAESRYATALNMVDEQIAVLAGKRVDLAVARQLQTDAVITAPFDGIIQELHVAPGMYPNIGQPIVTLVRVDPLRFRAGVPEVDALRVKIGQTIRIQLAGHSKSLKATVSRISPALDMSSRSLVIEADIPNSEAGFPVGLFAEADIIVDPDDRALAVPLTAIREFAGVEKVKVVSGDGMEERSIHTGRRRGNLVEVLDGLTAGDRVFSGAKNRQAAGVPSRAPDEPPATEAGKEGPHEPTKTTLGA